MVRRIFLLVGDAGLQFPPFAVSVHIFDNIDNLFDLEALFAHVFLVGWRFDHVILQTGLE